MQQSVNAFYYEKLVYLASMILRRANAADYRVQLNELKIGIAAGADDPQLGRNPLLPRKHPAFGLADAAHAAALAVGVPKFLEGPTIMRILLVLDRVENPASANALMGLRLTEQLLVRDHTVHILTLWDGLHTPPAPPQGRRAASAGLCRRAPDERGAGKRPKGRHAGAAAAGPAGRPPHGCGGSVPPAGTEETPPHRGYAAGN